MPDRAHLNPAFIEYWALGLLKEKGNRIGGVAGNGEVELNGTIRTYGEILDLAGTCGEWSEKQRQRSSG